MCCCLFVVWLSYDTTTARSVPGIVICWYYVRLCACVFVCLCVYARADVRAYERSIAHMFMSEMYYLYDHIKKM